VRLSDIAGGPFDPEDLLAHMWHDKKVEGGALTLILTRGIGRAYVEKGADLGPLAVFLKEEADV
jgi:3-dehydroquinate synthase